MEEASPPAELPGWNRNQPALKRDEDGELFGSYQPDPEEVRQALNNLDSSFTERLANAIFMPTNPFIAVSLPAISVMLCQTAWMTSTYVPLPAPGPDVSKGYEAFNRWESEESPDPPNLLPAANIQAERKRLLVFGDSLVLGIGCKEEHNSHILARTIARSVAREWGADIEWHSYGLNGGNVEAIHKAAMEFLNTEHPSHLASNLPHDLQSTMLTSPPATADSANPSIPAAASPHHLPAPATAAAASGAAATARAATIPPHRSADVCVIFCGLNDFKHLWKGRTASVFYRQLRLLLLDLRRALGPACRLLLPAMPFEPTRFPEPLRTFVIRLSAVYDAQKARLARELPGVAFLPKPRLAWWRRVHLAAGNIMAADGVHPNERGYLVYADFLGRAVAHAAAR